MSELMTLKDLVGIEDKCDLGKEVNDVLFSGEILRKEAIKWAKNINQELPSLSKIAKKEIFMDFFNLTEEDLEDE